MESTKSNLDLLNRKINDNLDYYFIKWLNSFEVNSVDIDMKSELVDRINDYKMNSYISSSLKNDGLDKYDIDIEINHPKYGIIRLEYRFNRFISSGSSGIIFSYNRDSINMKHELILKIPRIDERLTSKIESYIHYSLNIYQDLIYPVVIIPKIEYILTTDKKFYYILMEKYDGDIGYLFNLYHPLLKIKRNSVDSIESVGFNSRYLIIEILVQLCKILINLQDNFRFMHNDLKSANLLFKLNNPHKNCLDPNNLVIVISDFGGSSCYINDEKFTGTILGSESEFSEKKDLFMFIHMLLSFSKQRYELIEFFEDNQIFLLNRDLISSKENKWLKIYTYEMDGKNIHKSYNPRNFLDRISSLRF